MSTYTLTAVLGQERRKKTIHADSEVEAMFLSMKHVLDKAHANRGGAWEHGHIILSDSDGRALHVMDATR